MLWPEISRLTENLFHVCAAQRIVRMSWHRTASALSSTAWCTGIPRHRGHSTSTSIVWMQTAVVFSAVRVPLPTARDGMFRFGSSSRNQPQNLGS